MGTDRIVEEGVIGTEVAQKRFFKSIVVGDPEMTRHLLEGLDQVRPAVFDRSRGLWIEDGSIVEFEHAPDSARDPVILGWGDPTILDEYGRGTFQVDGTGRTPGYVEGMGLRGAGSRCLDIDKEQRRVSKKEGFSLLNRGLHSSKTNDLEEKIPWGARFWERCCDVLFW